MNELARKLGVSSSTVSRALTRPELVAAETRELVLAAVERHGYKPNRIAQSLRTRKTQSIGLIVSDITNPFYSALVRAVEGIASGKGFSVIICNADEDRQREDDALELLAEKQVAGIIHASTGANLDTLRKLRDQGVVLVDVDRVSGLEDTDTVLVDNPLGARLATEHLIGLGHTRIATIAGPDHLTTGRDRRIGYEQALLDAGMNWRSEWVETGDFRKESGYLCARRLLALEPPPTALFVANNEMMAGALAAVQECRVEVPQQLSIVSFDDVRWAEYLVPALTVVAQPTEELGRTAAELLFGRIEGVKEPVSRTLLPTLIVRGSTAPAGEQAARGPTALSTADRR
jgi:DNA-binding LacI/PurR family transcriptional regulator